jgi:hypothetical protein
MGTNAKKRSFDLPDYMAVLLDELGKKGANQSEIIRRGLRSQLLCICEGFLDLTENEELEDKYKKLKRLESEIIDKLKNGNDLDDLTLEVSNRETALKDLFITLTYQLRKAGDEVGRPEDLADELEHYSTR